ncbi:hypothetical protein BJ165DRAFT_77572 [Panaeolus papilionaceus]|nr:hypothetical protein BJ165DRAFT_77572 [Panaeolus papilionaceus]
MTSTSIAQDSNANPRLAKPLNDERFVRVVCIGAGVSGLVLAYKMRRSFKNFELVIYEKNSDVGGTWLENNYPGCACDVPSHTYTYTFEPKTDWSAVYAGPKEIQQYLSDFCHKYELGQYIKFNHQVSEAVWDQSSGEWKLSIKRREDGKIIQDRCHIFVNASGVLNTWKWPDIEGIDNFKGKLVHSANWDSSIDLKDKHVGLIGNGSSAIQILPAIYPEVRKLTNFIRSPTWVVPVLAEPQHSYTEEEKLKFQQDPEAHLQYRKAQGVGLAKYFPLFIKDSDAQKATTDAMKEVLKAKLPADVVAELTPEWGVGCRRITPGSDYLEKLGAEKTKVVVGSIARITEKGCVDSQGTEHPLDVLICATGFDTSFVPRFPILGADGVSLADAWKDEAKGYMGVGAAGFPNYFTLVGPGSPLATGPAMYPMELHADYILKMVDRYQTESIHSMVPKPEAVEDFVAQRDQFLKGTIWDDSCHSWYKSGKARKLAALWPGSGLHFVTVMSEPRYEDWDYQYNGNRFAYFGNGYSQIEMKDSDTADWAYFVRNGDDSPHLSKRERVNALTALKSRSEV